jgi:hypothetical protein
VGPEYERKVPRALDPRRLLRAGGKSYGEISTKTGIPKASLHRYLVDPRHHARRILQAPAPVIATMLGYSHGGTAQVAAEAGSPWSRYAPAGHARLRFREGSS